MMWASSLILLTLISPSSMATTLKVAILDTHFCPSKISVPKNIKLRTPIDYTKTHTSKSCDQYDEKNRLFHGHLVLKEFLDALPERPISISPISIFNAQGFRDPKAFKKAFSIQSDFDLIVIASGIESKKFETKVTTPLFVAGATFGRGIKKSTELWPQKEFNNPFVYTIGSYLEKDDYLDSRHDFNLIHKDQMKYFFSSKSKLTMLSGSSRAVSFAAAKAVSLCYDDIGKKKLSECLKRSLKRVKLKESNEMIDSY